MIGRDPNSLLRRAALNGNLLDQVAQIAAASEADRREFVSWRAARELYLQKPSPGGVIGVLTPEMFGAVGDGVADDTDALQNMLAAAAGATTTYALATLPGGDFLINDQLVIPPQTALVGGSRFKTRIKCGPGFRKAITGITRANPGVVTCNAHGFSNGDRIYINGVGGMTEVNQLNVAHRGAMYFVRNATTNTFEISTDSTTSIDTSGYTAYTSGGHASKPAIALGDPASTQGAFGSRLENLGVYGQNNVDIGVYTDRANENSGVQKVTIYDCVYNGIRIDNANFLPGATIAHNYFLRDLEVTLTDRANVAITGIASADGTGNANDDAVAIYIFAGSAAARGMMGVTPNCTGASIRASIQIEGAQGMHISEIHTEGAVDGILIGDLVQCVGITVQGITARGHTNGIHISNGSLNNSRNITIIAAGRENTGTNLIKDDVNNVTITNNDWGFYNAGNFAQVGALTGFGTASPSYFLDVQTVAVSSYIASFFNDGGANTSHGIRVQAGADANPSHTVMSILDGDGTGIGGIVGDGAGGTTFATSSDERLKQDIKTITGALGRVMALRPVAYRGKGAPQSRATTAGLIAQEVMAVMPEAALYDAEADLYSLAWDKVIPFLVGAIQELNARIAQLESGNRNEWRDATD